MMANEPLTDQTMARIERHMATERTLRDRAKAQRRGSDNTPPEGWQERHSPTEADEVVVMHTVASGPSGKAERVTKRKEVCRRRVIDARLWGRLSGELQDAANEIGIAFNAITSGMRVKIQNFNRTAHGQSDWSGRQASLVSDYFAWGRALQGQGLSHAMAIDILGFGQSCAETDRARRKPVGTARANLIGALEVYAKLQGWMR